MMHTVASSPSTRALFVALTLAASVPAAAQNVLQPAQSVLDQRLIGERPPLFRDPLPESADTSIAGLFRDTLRDFQRLPSRENALWLSFGGLAAGLGREFDHGVSAGLFKSAALDDVLSIGERAGGAKMQLASALTTYAVGRIAGHSRTSQIGADLIRANVLTQAMTASIKLSVGRTRPDGTEFSFPSGHSSVSFATATVLQRNLGWKVGGPAYAFATYVAASRVQDKRHFLSDVTFGAALGIVAGRTVTIGRGDAKFALSPTATPGGAGVQFAWMGKD